MISYSGSVDSEHIDSFSFNSVTMDDKCEEHWCRVGNGLNSLNKAVQTFVHNELDTFLGTIPR